MMTDAAWWVLYVACCTGIGVVIGYLTARAR